MEDGRFREILACGRSLQPTAPEHEAHLCNSPCFCGQNSERAARFIVVAAAVVEGLPVLPWSGGHGTLFLRSLPAVKRPSCRVPPASEDSLLGMESMGSAQLALPLLVLQPRRCRAARPQHAIVTQMCARAAHCGTEQGHVLRSSYVQLANIEIEVLPHERMDSRSQT